jgi:hypothetical protein
VTHYVADREGKRSYRGDTILVLTDTASGLHHELPEFQDAQIARLYWESDNRLRITSWNKTTNTLTITGPSDPGVSPEVYRSGPRSFAGSTRNSY